MRLAPAVSGSAVASVKLPASIAIATSRAVIGLMEGLRGSAADSQANPHRGRFGALPAFA
jgi:hypothetical protein